VAELPPKSSVVAQTKFGQASVVNCKFPKAAPSKQSYLILPCLQQAGTETQFQVRVSSAAIPTLTALTGEVPSTAHACTGNWTPALSGGYQKVENPQYLLTVPTKGMIKVSLARTDGAKDTGMIGSVYSSPPGYGGGRVTALSSGNLVTKTGFKISAGPLETEWVADAGTYVVVPSLQKKGTCGPFEVSVDGEVGPTLAPL